MIIPPTRVLLRRRCVGVLGSFTLLVLLLLLSLIIIVLGRAGPPAADAFVLPTTTTTSFKQQQQRQHPHVLVLLPAKTSSTSTRSSARRTAVVAAAAAGRSSIATTAAATNMILSSNKNSNNPTFCLTAILLLSTFGLSLERRTVLGKALSAPLATMALALIVANLGIVPFQSPIYTAVNQFLVPLAVPLLLYDSDLRRVMNDTGSLLACFGVGAVATVIGTVLAFAIIPLQSLGATTQSWKVACALAARHIGGAINFVAVAETLNIPGSAVSAAIAADNVVVALYFALLFALAKPYSDDEENTTTITAETIVAEKDVVKIESELDYSLIDTTAAETSTNDTNNTPSDQHSITLSTLSTAISVAATLVTVGQFVTRAVLPAGTSALPLTSVLTVLAATAAPHFFTQIRAAGTAVGILLIQLFFACSGASGSIRLVLEQAPALFAFSALQIAIHFGVLLALGRGLLRLNINELYLASNANVGGPTTAAAMAQAKGWKRLVLPALLVGILGYATATGIALALAPVLVRLLPKIVG